MSHVKILLCLVFFLDRRLHKMLKLLQKTAGWWLFCVFLCHMSFNYHFTRRHSMKGQGLEFEIVNNCIVFSLAIWRTNFFQDSCKDLFFKHRPFFVLFLCFMCSQTEEMLWNRHIIFQLEWFQYPPHGQWHPWGLSCDSWGFITEISFSCQINCGQIIKIALFQHESLYCFIENFLAVFKIRS